MENESAVTQGRISACFLELLAYTALLKSTCARRQPPVAEVRDTIRELLNRSAQGMRAAGVDPRDYDEARFAVCAWVDETILNMPWTHREEWLRSMLQSELYGTTRAGEEFFDRLNALRSDQNPVREVYYLCLCLGFIGRFCTGGDEFLLDQLRRSNLRILSRGVLETSALAGETLFDNSSQVRPTAAGPGRSGPFWSLPRILALVAPPVVVILLFFVYRFVLNGVVDSFLGRVVGS
ncbi:MAG: DotU family type IV/VI secretion system protein [Deltaproteobacteria bacterium]|nr:DotU family type IV/VI secretion system protein [Deltaproteobacteria bacterium]